MEGPAERTETPGRLHIRQPQTFVHILTDGDGTEKQNVFSTHGCFYERLHITAIRASVEHVEIKAPNISV